MHLHIPLTFTHLAYQIHPIPPHPASSNSAPSTPHSVKYLGLLAMSKILKSHPKSVQTHKDLVLQCLDDKDESIRLRALDLLYGMVGHAMN